MPKGAVYVGRGSKWGNPYRVGDHPLGDKRYTPYTPETAAAEFRQRGCTGSFGQEIVRELKGKDLACWCPLDKPCHADVLLEIANKPLAVVQPSEVEHD